MTDLYRVRTEITGGPGGPGVATHYFYDVATACTSLRTFWGAIGELLMQGIGYKVQDAGDIIDDATGHLTGAWTGQTTTTSAGGSGSKYAAAVGAQVRWNTDVIRDSHRLRGRTFLVPMSGNIFDLNGFLTDSATGTILTAANALITSQDASFAIWHRPFPGRPAVGSKPARAAFVGSSALVTSAAVPRQGAVLRSRRD